MNSRKEDSDFILFPPHSFHQTEMLAFESSRHQQPSYPPHLPMDPTMTDPFGIGMDDYSQYGPSQGLSRPAHSYIDSTQLYVESAPYTQPQMAFPPVPSTPPSITTPQSSEPHMPGLSSASGPSIASASSSAIGSPYSAAAHGLQDQWIDTQHGLGLPPAVLPDMFSLDYAGNVVDTERLFPQDKYPSASVDPSLIQPPQQTFFPPSTLSYADEPSYALASQGFFASSPIGSPLPQGHHMQPVQQQVTSSPFLTQTGFQPRSGSVVERRSSVSSSHSRPSQQSPVASNAETDEEGREKGRCPHPDCGRVFRDLKAHMLTHQSERPEKCPIVTCEYHIKGFARKYDKNRHTLTHYKGTMVCGFCPGSGSAAEKSFNRADVFKRHLTSVHGVEQTPPNCRKRTPAASNKKVSGYCDDATGKCSTCSATFSNAQDFYEHLDECVLRVVQQEEPSEAINQQRLAEVAADEEVKKTMEKHMLPNTAGSVQQSDADNDEDDEDDFNDAYNLHGRSGKGSLKSTKAGGNAHSRPILGNNNAITKQSQTTAHKARPSASKKRNNRRNYPPSWGCPSSEMKTKKRVLCVFDGQNRLWKDEMMLDNEFEVRLRLPGGAGDGTNRDAYVTDLDIETMKRAEGILNATEEERGPLLGPPSTRLMGPPAMLLPELSHGHVEEVDIDELIC